MTVIRIDDTAAGAAPTPGGGRTPVSTGIIDLFAGPGGWDQGLVMLGRRDVVGVEWDGPACETARAAGHARVQADVAELDPGALATGVGWTGEGFIASPPCQSWSMAGKGKGRSDTGLILAGVEQIAAGRHPRGVLARLRHRCADPRTALVVEPLRWVLDLRPQWVALEQVPPVLPLWEAFAEVFRSVGYTVATGNVQAEQYGVPQTRKRAVLAASLAGAATLPAPTHSRYHSRDPQRLDPGTLPWVSMARALIGAGLPLLGDTLRSNYGTNGDPASRGERSIGQAAPTVTSKINRNMWQVKAYGSGMVERHGARRPRFSGEPSFTITATSGGGSERLRWAELDLVGATRVTVAEAAVLQSFPADYPWWGNKGQQYRQVGDAVPPLLAAHVLDAVGAGIFQADVEEAS